MYNALLFGQIYSFKYLLEMLRKCKLAFSSLNNDKKYDIFILEQLIQTFPSASNSVILSAAAYLVKHFPDMPHPQLMKNKLPHQRVDGQYPSLYLSVHPLFDEWVQLFGQLFFQHNVFRVNGTLYLRVQVGQEFGEYLKHQKWAFQTHNHNLSVTQIFGIKDKHSQKRIGWINCSTSQLNRRVYEPNVNSIAVLLGQIYNNQQYFLHNILKGQIPTVQELLSYDCIFIPGSGLSVLSSVPRIQEVTKVIQTAYEKSDKLKILGICYGHQLMAQMFGAKVVKRQRYGGLQQVNFSKQVAEKYEFLQPIAKYSKMNLLLSQHHQDFVTTAPPGYLVLAVSNSCQNQAFVSENGRIFTTQFHPQYCYPYTKGYTSRIKVFKTGKIDKLTYAHVDEVIDQHMKHTELMRECIRKFI